MPDSLQPSAPSSSSRNAKNPPPSLAVPSCSSSESGDVAVAGSVEDPWLRSFSFRRLFFRSAWSSAAERTEGFEPRLGGKVRESLLLRADEASAGGCGDTEDEMIEPAAESEADAAAPGSAEEGFDACASLSAAASAAVVVGAKAEAALDDEAALSVVSTDAFKAAMLPPSSPSPAVRECGKRRETGL